MADDTIYIANETFAAEVDGVPYMIRKGIDRVRGAHPLYKQTSMYWDPVEDKVTYDVERATKEPGERRGDQSVTTIKMPPAAVSQTVRNDGDTSGHAVPDVADIAATPSALAHAESLGIDLSTIKGTGKDGTILKSDVEAAEQARAGTS